MSPSRQRPVVIVGGGVSGLTLGALLAERGVRAVVVEKEERPGGLARSFRYGDFVFDIGPHRFHTDVEQVERFIRKVLAADALSIPRMSQVRFEGHFYNWPLHPSYTMLRFPPMLALSAMRDLLLLFNQPPPVTFRDQIVNMYGETLYRHFFQGYTAKFLGIVPEMTHPDWAKTGVDRAIIDSRVKMNSLGQLLLGMLDFRRRPETTFLYARNGIQTFVDNLVRYQESLGGQVLCGRAVDALATEGSRITALRVGRRTFRPAVVVWTGTIHSLAGLLDMPRPALRYLALICYNLMLTEGEHFPFQWCYHGEADVAFSRVSIPANFDPSTTPPGHRSMCVEVTCAEDDAVWSDPDGIIDRLVFDMKREALLQADREIIDVRTERIPWAYPVYQLDYREKIAAFEREAERWDNLLLAGRLGRFWYNNMDHCIDAAYRHTDEVLALLAGRSPARSEQGLWGRSP